MNAVVPVDPDVPGDRVRTAELLAGPARTRAVRRRVLDAQLARLVLRGGDVGPAARDAAVRAIRVAARLEHDQLEW